MLVKQLISIACYVIQIQKISSVAIDNDVADDPIIECMDDKIRFWVQTRKYFAGRIYAKGRADHPPCIRADFAKLKTREPHFDMSFGYCGMQTLRSLDPRGMFYSITVMVSFHPLFITKVDKAFHVKCFFEEASAGLTAEIGVSMVPTTEVTAAHTVPGCRYSIHRSTITELDGGYDPGPAIQFARVGDKVLHRWQCDDPMFGILINNCYVTDGFGQRADVVDARGCPVDPILITGIRYASDLTTAYAESHVFKFADKPGVWFFCQLQMCMQGQGMCHGITPPSCASTAPNPGGYGDPPPSYPSPTPDGYGAPAPSYPAPAPSYPAPAPNYPAPAPSYPAPAPSYPAPAPSYPAPAPSYPAPAPSYPAPAPTYPAPSYPSPAPSNPAPAPSYPAPAPPRYPAPAPSYPAPAPSYPAPAPSYPAPSPSYPAPAPSYPSPAPAPSYPSPAPAPSYPSPAPGPSPYPSPSSSPSGYGQPSHTPPDDGGYQSAEPLQYTPPSYNPYESASNYGGYTIETGPAHEALTPVYPYQPPPQRSPYEEAPAPPPEISRNSYYEGPIKAVEIKIPGATIGEVTVVYDTSGNIPLIFDDGDVSGVHMLDPEKSEKISLKTGKNFKHRLRQRQSRHSAEHDIEFKPIFHSDADFLLSKEPKANAANMDMYRTAKPDLPKPKIRIYPPAKLPSSKPKEDKEKNKKRPDPKPRLFFNRLTNEALKDHNDKFEKSYRFDDAEKLVASENLMFSENKLLLINPQAEPEPTAEGVPSNNIRGINDNNIDYEGAEYDLSLNPDTELMGQLIVYDLDEDPPANLQISKQAQDPGLGPTIIEEDTNGTDSEHSGRCIITSQGLLTLLSLSGSLTGILSFLLFVTCIRLQKNDKMSRLHAAFGQKIRDINALEQTIKFRSRSKSSNKKCASILKDKEPPIYRR